MNEAAQSARKLLLDRAARLKEISNELGLNTLGETIVADAHRRLDDSLVRVSVLGEIKQGKSTLINALLGEDVLPTGVTPTTGAVVLIRAGEHPGAFLDKGSGERESLQPPRFTRLAKGPLQKHVKISDEDDGSLEYIVKVGMLPEGLEIADTPGINDIAAFRGAIAQGELPRADIIILVLDATQLLNRTEMAFLRDAVAAVGGLADSGAKLLLAVNRIDLIAERERPKLVEHLHKELATLTGSEQAPNFEVFLTDARTSCRTPHAKTPGVEGLTKLRKRLLELATQRSEILPLRAKSSLLRHTTLLGHNAAIASRAVSLEISALRKEITRVERELEEHEFDMAKLRSQMAVDRDLLLEASAKRTEEFRDQLEASSLELLRSIPMRTLSSHFAGSLHDAFLAFAHKESEQLRTHLDELTRKAILTHSEQARRRLFHATMRLGFRGPTIYVDPPSIVLEAGLVVVGIAGTAALYFGNIVVGLVMAVASPLTTLVLREKSVRNARTHAAQEVPKALDRASEALREQIRKVIDGHLAALDEHLLLANIALGEQLKGVLHQVESQIQSADKTPAKDGAPSGRERLSRGLQQLEHELAGIRNELQALGEPAQV